MKAVRETILQVALQYLPGEGGENNLMRTKFYANVIEFESCIKLRVVHLLVLSIKICGIRDLRGKNPSLKRNGEINPWEFVSGGFWCHCSIWD